ncbi:hypothetical protein ACFRJ9_12110 [Paenarthrobacter sp. NPDC056912]|uniref:hypothetical protein n=1 Tax=Paenarthrobacter sp. NPDC056912 TaxID=3345965 RepID=UPI0036715C2B
MGLSRRLLYRSDFWEIARPRHPLSAGHVLVRLSDPSTEFAHASAADWLHCHHLVRLALREVLGATRCTIMFAHRWHPLGSAVGEPVAESSTPTFHLFGRWEGETTTPGLQLALPAHRRGAEPDHVMEATDDAMREALRHARPEAAVRSAGQAGSAVEPVPDFAAVVETIAAGPNHSVIEPASGRSGIAGMLPEELLAMGAALNALPLAGGLSGFSCVAVESTDKATPLRVHALGRSAAEEVNPLEVLLRSQEVSLALL